MSSVNKVLPLLQSRQKELQALYLLQNTAELAQKCVKVINRMPSAGTRGLYCLLA